MQGAEIRPASVDDTDAILSIYEYYVLNTAISFEYKVPDISEFKQRIETISEKYPYYIAVIDNKIVGYAYASAFGEREAYKFSVELSVYIDKDYKKQGIGKLLYSHLENELKKMGITNLYARVVVPDVEDEYISSTAGIMLFIWKNLSMSIFNMFGLVRR